MNLLGCSFFVTAEVEEDPIAAVDAQVARINSD